MEVYMKNINLDKTIAILNEVLEYELAGVVKYTHFALMVTGPYRFSLDKFFKEQASESLEHAQQAGELLTGLGGHPSQAIPKIEETNKHSIKNLLNESLNHEEKAVSLYKDLLKHSEGKSLYIEEYAREMIKQEEMHGIEIKKMLRDYDN
jgi:bacterioferritin